MPLKKFLHWSNKEIFSSLVVPSRQSLRNDVIEKKKNYI